MTNEQEEQMISGFVNLLHHKGYRGHFLMDQTAGERIMMKDDLRDCLRTSLNLHKKGGQKESSFQLETHPGVSAELLCTLRLTFDEVHGFRVRQFLVTKTSTQEEKTYRISNNAQIPGSQAVQGLFPKPKPWDKHLKGKFRP